MPVEPPKKSLAAFLFYAAQKVIKEGMSIKGRNSVKKGG